MTNTVLTVHSLLNESEDSNWRCKQNIKSEIPANGETIRLEARRLPAVIRNNYFIVIACNNKLNYV